MEIREIKGCEAYNLFVDRIGVTCYTDLYFGPKVWRVFREKDSRQWHNYIRYRVRKLAKADGATVERVKIKGRKLDKKKDKDAVEEFIAEKSKALDAKDHSGCKNGTILKVYWGYEKKRIWFRGQMRWVKSQVYYVFAWDEKYHIVSFRICTWAPFLVLAYINGVYALEMLCKEKGVEHETFLNSFLDLEMSREEVREAILDNLDINSLETMLSAWLNYLFPLLGNRYSFTFNQIEFCVDHIFPDEETCHEGTKGLIFENHEVFGRRVALILDKAFRITAKDKRESNFVSKLDLCERPRATLTAKGLQLKIYCKGRLMRIELTYNSEYMKWIRLDRRGLAEIYDHASETFRKIEAYTETIVVRENPRPTAELYEILNTARFRESNISFFKALPKFFIGEFMNRDIRECTDLNRCQVYYLIGRKFRHCFEKLEGQNKWRITAEGLRYVLFLLRTHEETLAFTLELFSEEPVGEVEVGIGRVTVSPLKT